ncbi:MAG: hypothetical protein FJW86_10020 [Actinobacteria bacterium]|nr:hypothetical protein [Actinomycetota bacterium]
MAGELIALARRGKGQAPPPWVVFEALTDPFGQQRQWFDLQSTESAPEVLDSHRPSRVVWSSIWSDRPDLRIEFTIETNGSGSALT